MANIQNNYQARGYQVIAQEDPILRPKSTLGTIVSVVGNMFTYPFTCCCSYIVVPPRTQAIVSYFGTPNEVITDSGTHYRNPIGRKVTLVSIALTSLELKEIKVNDKNGIPVLASVTVYWKVNDVVKYAFKANDPQRYLKDQAKVTLQEICKKYSFDCIENQECLRLPSEAMKNKAKEILENFVTPYGMNIEGFNFTDVCYEKDMQSIFLERQKALAHQNAQKETVDGVSSIAADTIKKLEEKLGIKMKDELKAEAAVKVLLLNSANNNATTVNLFKHT